VLDNGPAVHVDQDGTDAIGIHVEGESLLDGADQRVLVDTPGRRGLVHLGIRARDYRQQAAEREHQARAASASSLRHELVRSERAAGPITSLTRKVRASGVKPGTYGGNVATSYPLDLLGTWLRRLFTFVVPLAFVAYVPASRMLGRPVPLGLPVWSPWATPLVALTAALVARATWHVAIRHHRSTGS
jgi:hypothetical protein